MTELCRHESAKLNFLHLRRDERRTAWELKRALGAEADGAFSQPIINASFQESHLPSLKRPQTYLPFSEVATVRVGKDGIERSISGVSNVIFDFQSFVAPVQTHPTSKSPSVLAV